MSLFCFVLKNVPLMLQGYQTRLKFTELPFTQAANSEPQLHRRNADVLSKKLQLIKETIRRQKIKFAINKFILANPSGRAI
jgi:hypothetical protein